MEEKQHKKIIENLKTQYNNINPDNEGEFLMKKSIKQAKKDKKTNIIKYISMGIVAEIAVFIIAPNISPNIAMAMSNIPIIGKVVDIITLDKYTDKDKNIMAELPKAIDKETPENNKLDELNAQTEEYIKSLTETFKNQFQTGDNKSLDITYDVLLDNEELFTLRINGLETKASGYEFFKIYNLDKNTAEILELKDIFKENEQYIDILSTNIKEQMKAQMKNNESKIYFIENEDSVGEVFEKISENQKFYFNDNNQLVIVFDEYEVAPGSMGSVEFIIPNELIENILK